jgi:hypothetical protein
MNMNFQNANLRSISQVSEHTLAVGHVQIGADYIAPKMQDLRVERRIMWRDMKTLCLQFDLDWFFDVIGWSEPATLWAGFVGSNPLKGRWTDHGVILSERLFWYARWSRNTVFWYLYLWIQFGLQISLNLVLKSPISHHVDLIGRLHWSGTAPINKSNCVCLLRLSQYGSWHW